MNAAEISRALKGYRHGAGYLCRCPLPTHGNGKGDRRPSLSIRDGEDERLLVHCFAGCDPRDVLAELRRRGLLDDDRRDHHERRAPIACEAAEEPPPSPNPLALDLWRAAEPIGDSLAQTYLRNRGLIVDAMPTLRFLPRAAHDYLPRVPFDAMIAAVQASDRSIIAAQLTWLDPSGAGKAKIEPPRRTIGGLHDGAIRLGAAGDELGLAEGTETARAAMQMSGVPCWASLGSKRMAAVRIPDTVKRLHIFSDHDDAGRACAEEVARAHRSLRVVVHTPQEPFGDFADVAQHLAKGKAAA
ncbi:toprim domain-containing protein [Methylosinus sp. PW1]|uniref:DUF7146 domain-containing protein n=1 Tax=Methylosinus sp. PW1 TaxID=107636 RepID=UPI00068E350C|nr:toprim domain-containing protein [Methylosinus sp. PW1]